MIGCVPHRRTSVGEVGRAQSAQLGYEMWNVLPGRGNEVQVTSSGWHDTVRVGVREAHMQIQCRVVEAARPDEVIAAQTVSSLHKWPPRGGVAARALVSMSSRSLSSSFATIDKVYARRQEQTFLCESWGVVESEWARTSLTVWHGASEEHTEMSGDTLVEQLAQAEDLLGQLGTAAADPLPEDLSVRLFCSWTPRDGQHAMSLPQGLIKALAAVDGAFWMDFYPSDSGEHVAES